MARRNSADILRAALDVKKAKDPSKSGWVDRHRAAMLRPYGYAMTIRMMLQGLALYADQHWTRYGSSIGNGGVLGRAWRDALEGVRALLNGELDGLDAGVVDAAICEVAANEGATL